MQKQSFSTVLRELSKSYYNHYISFHEYRAQRRELLDKIDTYFNGAQVSSEMVKSESEITTQPFSLGDTSMFSVPDEFNNPED